ncbi:class I SAM-dependent methyltransferase [Kitasatospora sp. NPDC092286]|uniref:class I SAM-dependent methyltransferase n=1 Tax=Kitasatospora sp. NPDC092286 TaxID=3364087 RepID=UPI003809A06E
MRTTTLPELWDPTTFDALRRRLIPSFDLLYGSAAGAVALTVAERPRILDLGAGTGLLSAAVLDRIPGAELLLVDHSAGMLGQAVDRFRGNPRIATLVGELTAALPDGPFDAVVSGLAIHHLPHEEKRDLFARIHRVLAPGGVFVNVEQLLAPSPRLEPMYDHRHEAHVHASGTPAEEWAAGRRRMAYDICADLDSQLTWLREAGFQQVDCLAKDWRFATYAGWRAL